MTFVLTKAHRAEIKAKIFALVKEHSIGYLECYFAMRAEEPTAYIVKLRPAESAASEDPVCCKRDIIDDLNILTKAVFNVDGQSLASERIVIVVDIDTILIRVTADE